MPGLPVGGHSFTPDFKGQIGKEAVNGFKAEIHVHRRDHGPGGIIVQRKGGVEYRFDFVTDKLQYKPFLGAFGFAAFPFDDKGEIIHQHHGKLWPEGWNKIPQANGIQQ